MMGTGRFGGLLKQETLKPKNLSETLARLGSYFSQFWYMIAARVGAHSSIFPPGLR